MAVERLSQASIGTLNKYSSMMAGSAFLTDFQLITTQVLSSAVASVTFSGIDQTYRHLQLRITARDTSAGTSNGPLYMTFNGDSAGNYSVHRLSGNGSAVASSSSTSSSSMWVGDSIASGSTAGVYGAAIVDILDYSQTTKYKTIRNLSGVTGTNIVDLTSGSWRNTAAVTSLTISAALATTAVGSRFSLYGWN